MTITITWALLGKLAVTGLALYFIFAFVVLTTMDSGWWLPWPLGFLAMAAVVYGVWLA